MWLMKNRSVIGRESNVVLVDFNRKPDPPAPTFPGASGLREIDVEDCKRQSPSIAMKAAT
jgi:hypothetical protein